MYQKLAQQYIIPLIGIAIVFGFGYLPPIEPISPMGMKILGIFIGMIFLWSFSGILWSSLLGIIALGMSGFAPLPKVIGMSFGDNISALILFSMILFGAIQQAGITRYVARWLITRKILNGRPFLFSFVFMYTAYFLSLPGTVLPAIMLMWSVLYSFFQEVGFKKGDRYTAIMVVGTFFGAISGQAGKPFMGSALMVLGTYEKVAGSQVDYLQYMLFGWILCTTGIILYALLMKYVLRPDVSRIANLSVDQFNKNPLPPMQLHQKIMAGILVAFLVLVLAPSFMPAGFPGIAILNKLGPLGLMISLVLMMCLVKINDKPLMDFKEIVSKHVVWDAYLLVAMIVAISQALVAPDMGIVPFLMKTLNPVLGGHTSYTFLVILILVSCTVTQVANNALLGVVLMPIISAFCMQNGTNFEAAAVIIVFATHIALLTPASSPFASLLHANTEWIDKKDVMKYSLCALVLSIASYVIFGIPVSNLIYG